ncbi:RMD1 family protein [Marinoscillum sp. MHG1-6]|uniref:RMD1 family protein n=1 Tax=Marinoscillum sp. MHG1-6 TaxID=2959627 RepID=UPI002157FA14|nr:RMD1 family protein [Marinoscillum sp. MHG1-6]
MKDRIMYTAYCISDRLDLNGYKERFPENLISKGSRELYYEFNSGSHIFLLSYGVIVFSGMTDAQMEEYLDRISGFAINVRANPIKDDFQTRLSKDGVQIDLSFDALTLGRFDHSVNKLIMMNLAQSVALDHYNALSQYILGEIKSYTQYMQVHGKVKLGHRQALKFIGRTLNTKNNIAENLYILDSPEAAWQDEYLDRLHHILARHFELVQRNREIENTLKIIEDNLAVYTAYNHHRESSRLEWIIIILIVIEVLDTLLTKFF